MAEDTSIVGRVITEARSSLSTFACWFADGNGLLLQAQDDQTPVLTKSFVPASQLPRDSDAVCKVDWSWITGSSIVSAEIDKTVAKLKLDQAGPLTISVQVWQGKPFLAFQPFRKSTL